jgi:NodT family efflux transporter outer membrane factor (OMF) lipoprotein
VKGWIARSPAALFALALCGCLVGPDFAPPAQPAPDAWRGPLAGELTADDSDEASLARWWDALGDPLLGELERRAFAGSRDLAIAEARLREARARRGGARAGLLPNVGASASAGRTHAERAIPETRESYDVALDASWEIDLFGGLRRGVEAASADLAAAEADLRAVRIAIAAEMAQAYADLRALQRRIALAEENVRAQSETLDLTRWRSEAGLTTSLDVAQARANLEQTRAALPQLRSALAASSARIAVLAGEPPGALDVLLGTEGPVPAPPERIAVGVPAAALARRPDVARAERQLAAETARIGVAKAGAFPRLTLTGSLGLDALAASNLFSSASYSSSVLGSLTQIVLDFGRVRATIRAQEAVRDAALAELEATLLEALEETENALVAFAEEQQRRDALAATAEAADLAAQLSRDQYASGLVDFESVLAAERALFTSQDQLAASEGLVASNLARLYKALGGGWQQAPQSGARSEAESSEPSEIEQSPPRPLESARAVSANPESTEATP